MPLSEPGARTPIHLRRIACAGYLREDGNWDIEGHLVDTKDYAFTTRHRGLVEAGEPVHDMWLRLTIDDRLTILAVEARTDASPYTICGEITGNFERLVGLSIGPGWRRRVLRHLGGPEGCTHLVELLGPIATTAFQTVFPYRAHLRHTGQFEDIESTLEELDGPEGARVPPLLNACHAFRDTSPVVRVKWPDFYRGD